MFNIINLIKYVVPVGVVVLAIIYVVYLRGRVANLQQAVTSRDVAISQQKQVNNDNIAKLKQLTRQYKIVMEQQNRIQHQKQVITQKNEALVNAIEKLSKNNKNDGHIAPVLRYTINRLCNPKNGNTNKN